MTYGASRFGIYIRSYDGDARWLERTLPVNLERLSGYDRVVVQGIPGESREIRRICDKNGVEFVPDFDAALVPNGYLNQQYSKLHAHEAMPDCEYILFVDSDCVATAEQTPDVWFGENNKLHMLHTPWNKVGNATCWRIPTFEATGIMPQYEFMRRLPQIYPAWLVNDTLTTINQHNRCSLRGYLSRCSAFSEFNCMGAVAWEHYHDEFDWIDTETMELPDHPWRQAWSHGDIDEQIGELYGR